MAGAAGFVQPLGEYAGRRSVLERVPFVSGYGVEIGLLVDLLELAGLPALAQVDLGVRRHLAERRGALDEMAGQVVSAVLARRNRRVGQTPALDASGLLTQFRHDGSAFVPAAARRRRRAAADGHGDRIPRPSGRTGRLTRVGAARRSPRGTGGSAARRPLPPSCDRPEVVAHRGATAEAPEHTLPGPTGTRPRSARTGSSATCG